MSHNITMKDVRISNLALLGEIAGELSNGVVSLVNPSANFRTYRGQPNTCDAMLQMPGNHDVGLIKNDDDTYSPVFDPYSMSPILKSPHGKSYIGALMQEYVLREAEYEAAQQGLTATRLLGENGLVTLELVAA